MPLFEVEWTNGEEITPGVLAWWSATVEASTPDEADAQIDEIEAQMRQMDF
ncbi:hypothetical protein [Frankia tisae]|uniref:hypothetical protein n=1 Tax=Frankia tisae TaxID=2950104 RepID=UPI0021BF3161|nr:hypothetical protein [Frankia tisae]